MEHKTVIARFVLRIAVKTIFLIKMNSLYQISSKMLHSTKVIILVEKKRKEVAWLGFKLTTSMLEVESANHYTMDPS
jgi:hypothetical protein